MRTSAEFGDLLWEVAGELGTSHAYVMPSGTFSARSALRGQPAALLGADVARAPDGRWLVERVLPGESSDPRARSPFAAPGVAVREGDEILAVDGRPLDPVHGPWPALAGTHGKPVELTIKPADPSLVPRPPPSPTTTRTRTPTPEGRGDGREGRGRSRRPPPRRPPRRRPPAAAGADAGPADARRADAEARRRRRRRRHRRAADPDGCRRRGAGPRSSSPRRAAW